MKSTSRLKLVATAASVFRAATRPGAPSVTERVQSVPRLVRATLNGSYAGTSRGRLALLAAAVAYVVSPVDLVPEAILPVVGAADDAVVISWAIKTLLEETDRFLAWELGQGVRRSTLSGGAVVAPSSAGRSTASRVPSGGPRATVTGGAAGRASGAGPRERAGAHVREVATNYVLESVRKRLER